MLRSLKIENFRCFQNFELQQLGRINLLVGKNNSGKTSILEALHLLTDKTNLESLTEIMLNRGEYILNNEHVRELDIRHLFYNHQVDIGSSFSISSSDITSITLSVKHPSKRITGTTLEIKKYLESTDLQNLPELQGLILDIKWLKRKNSITLPLSLKKSLPLDYTKYINRNLENLEARTQFVTSSSLTIQKTSELFDQIVLTRDENLVTESLQIIEPNIERIAIIGSEEYRYNGAHRYDGLRSGFVVRLANSEQRIPIGSMGDGIWRILGLTLAIVNAKNGVLLVDEIDTGLHFSTMSDMWKLIWETAKRLNVQVFATTHSDDCWKSLDAISSLENPSEDGIMIHRIEKGKSHSIAFTERQIAIAAERGIEVR
jgi:AAA15 family ATPase/GTPase